MVSAVNKAVFLDKDGTLIKDIPYNVDINRIVFYDSTFNGLRLLSKHGYRLFIVSNQAGLALGLFDEKNLSDVIDFISSKLSEEGIKVDGFYYCPHSPSGVIPEFTKACHCRKPADGLLTTAATEHGISLERSWMIGDILNDVEAGNRAGCRSILLNNNNETEWDMAGYRKPFAVAADMEAAARIIIETDGEHERPLDPLQESAMHQA
jgi:D-glycero-D-manno-heptose 1,7-bisphosphate phosphatase